MLYSKQNRVLEWEYASAKRHDDPFNEIELSVIITDPDGRQRTIPAFWGGADRWRIRYSSPRTGIHHFRTLCSDPSDAGLHSREGDIKITPGTGGSPLSVHGRLRVSANGRYLEHADGTPFFWLADTWWMGLCGRMMWPVDFQTLALDRIEKGFSVVQIVAGLYPDMPQFDLRGANEAGFPWEQGYERIRPEYFDLADRRIEYLVEMGLVPCLVGCWGYFLRFMGLKKIKKHWRYLVARYGAYPAVWCLAGEFDMPYYLSDDKEADREAQREGWREAAEYVRDIDPYRNPVTIHPGSFIREVPGYAGVLDFEMLQTGHSDQCIGQTVRRIRDSYGAEPVMPVIDAEVAYEGIGGQCREQIQRLVFWACMLGGAAGHTYGANGIWQVNTKEQPFGPSPHGMSWGDTPWDEAARLPGSRQLGVARKLLERYPWQRFEPHPEWIQARVSEDHLANCYHPYIAGIPGEVRIAYLPFYYPEFIIKGLEEGVRYRAYLFNPANGDETDIGVIEPVHGEFAFPQAKEGGMGPRLPIYQDWALVMERADSDQCSRS